MSESPLSTGLLASSAADLKNIWKYLLRWLPISLSAGVLAGSASALLLWSLDVATSLREAHRWVIALLPLAGLLVGWLYLQVGSSVATGNTLILEEIHDPRQTIPLRMTPLILLGTFMTHLFGGSAGREGTAIQTGASLADQLTRLFRLQAQERRVLLMTGISAGFSSVFGTPLAGTVFGMEVLALGSIGYEAIVPCLLAAVAGDLTTRAWGMQHTVYRVLSVPPLNLRGLLLACVAGGVFGLTARGFVVATHTVTEFFSSRFHWPPLRPFVGGVLIAVAVFAVGTTKYIGLGDPTILAAFKAVQPPYEFAAKFLFTVMTLGSGFKGGEVTPLFFIGATLGSALSAILPLPPSLLAGMGFVAVFAGAANTPLTSTLMAAELFGGETAAYAGIAGIVSYFFSGHNGIYQAQRIGARKYANLLPPPESTGPSPVTPEPVSGSPHLNVSASDSVSTVES